MCEARTLVRAGPKVPVRSMNETDQDQVLSGGTIIGHGQPAMWAATIDKQKPRPRWKQGLGSEPREVMAGARPNLSIREAQALEEFLVDYQEDF